MNDLSRAFLHTLLLFVGAPVVGTVIDTILPWNLGLAVSLLLLHAGIGFTRRWYIGNHGETQLGTSTVTFHVKKRRFVSETVGRWWNPLHIVSKLEAFKAVGGQYTPSENRIDINLPVMCRYTEHDDTPVDTPEEAVVYVLEHEAIHSAIPTFGDTVYQKIQETFRTRFRNAPFSEKVWIYLKSSIYHFGGFYNVEERMVEQLQEAHRGETL